MLKVAALILLWAPPLWSAGIFSSDKPKPVEKSGPGDVQVGTDVEDPKRPLPKTKSRPGIYPVYEADGRWMLIERESSPKSRRVSIGANVALIGSTGVEVFRVQRSTKTLMAACKNKSPSPTQGYFLTAKSASKFKKVGTPIIAILLPKGRKFDTRQARFYALKNGVKEDTYRRLQAPIREDITAELRAGLFQIDVADDKGQAFARAPEPEQIQMKIDFGSKIRYRGLRDAYLLIDGVQISKTYRRCMRMFDGTKQLGQCAEMPHELNVETQQMNFVAYDPARRGRPYIFAFTEKEPLWGHERWGFQMMDSGPQIFMRDALDPRCRESF